MIDVLRRNRDLRLLWIAQVISFGGDWFATVALLGVVKDLTHSSFAVAMVFVSQSLPGFVLSTIAGPVADRYDRKRIMVSVSLVQTVVALNFLFIGAGRVWVAFVVQGTVSALAAFFGPASQAALPNLVSRDDLAKASAVVGSTWGAMLAIGSGLGGLFTVLFGRHAAFVADAATFLVAAALVAAVKGRTRAADTPTKHGRVRPLADTREAIHHARDDHMLLALLSSKAGFGLASGVVALLTILASSRFHYGDGGVGLFLAARGIGVVFGPVLAVKLARVDNIASILRACALSAMTYGLCYGVVAVVPWFALALVFVLLAHLGGGTQWTLSTIGLQLVTPDELRGRILAADYALVTAMLSLSFAVSGAVAKTTGPAPVMLVLAVISVAWGVLYLTLGRKLTRHHAAQPSATSS